MAKRTHHEYYRRIYRNHHGSIPKESNGRSYEIHHVDGNHENNDPSNLIAITIQEHYDIHYSQGDWGACLNLANRMKLSPDEKTKIAINHNKKMVEQGVHPFLTQEDGTSIGGKSNKERIENGSHHFLGDSNPTHNRMKNKTHHFIGGEVQRNSVKNGTHAVCQKWQCPHCGKVGQNAAAGFRWHFNNCRHINAS